MGLGTGGECPLKPRRRFGCGVGRATDWFVCGGRAMAKGSGAMDKGAVGWIKVWARR